MAADKEVKLVIRAKDEASKAVGLITKTLDDFSKNTISAEKAVADLGKGMDAMNRAAGKINAFDKVAEAANVSAAAVTRLEAAIKDASDEQTRLIAASAAAVTAERQLAQQVEVTSKALDQEKAKLQQLKQARKELSGSETGGRTAEEIAAINAKTDALAKQRAVLAEIRASQVGKRDGERDSAAIDAARKAVGAEESSLADLKKTIASAVAARKEAATKAIADQSEVVKATKATARETASSYAVASEQSLRLATASERAGEKISRLTEDLSAAKTEAAKVAEAAAMAEKSLGRLESASRSRMIREIQNQRATAADLKAQWQKATADLAAQGGAAKVGPNLPGAQASLDLATAYKRAYQEQRESIERLSRSMKAAAADFGSLSTVQKAFADSQAVTADRIKAVQAALESANAARRAYAAPVTSAAIPAQTAPLAAQTVPAASRPAPVYRGSVPASSGGFDEEIRQRNTILNLLGLEQRESRAAMSVYQRLRGEVLSAITAYAGFQGVISLLQQVVQATGQLNAITIKLNVMAGSKQGGAQELAWVRSEAERLGLVFRDVGDQWAKFSLATKNSNISLQESRGIFSNMATAFRAMNLGEEGAKGAMLALTQMVSKGTIQAEELRQQLGERLPGAFSLMAKAVGVSEAQLAKMMENAQVTSRYLVDFAKLVADQFRDELPNAIKQTSALIALFKNAWFDALTTMGESGLIDEVNAKLKQMTAYLKSDEGVVFFKKLGSAGAGVISVLGSLAENARTFGIILGGWAGLKIGAWLAGLTQSFALLRAEMVATTAAASASSTVTAASAVGWSSAATSTATAARNIGMVRSLLTGPAGIIVGVGLATSALAGWATSTENVSTAAESHARVVRDIANEYAKVGGELDKVAQKQKDAWLFEAQRSREANQQRLQEYQSAVQRPALAAQLDSIRGMNASRAQSGLYPLQIPSDLQGIAPQLDQITKLVDQFKKGEIGASDFRQSLQALGKSVDDVRLRRYIAALTEIPETGDNMVSMALKAEKALKDLDAVTKSLTTGDGAVMRDQLDLSSGLNKTAEGAGNAKTALEQYEEALKNLRQFIPSQDPFYDMDQKLGKAKGQLSGALSVAAERSMSPKDLNSIIDKEFVEPLRAAGNNTQQVEMIIGLTAEKLKGDTALVTKALRDFAAVVAALANDVGQKQLSAMGFNTDSYYARVRYLEDGGNPTAKNPRSTAYGIGQFTEGTWLDQFDRRFPELASWSKEAKLQARSNEKMARDIFDNFTKENALALQKANFAPSQRNLYMAHMLGAGGATATLGANPNAPIASVLSPDAIRSNPEVLGGGKSVAEVMRYFDQKMGVGGGAIQPNGATAQEEIASKIQQRVDALKAEASARQESSREMEIQQELNRWAADAAKEGLKLTAEQEAAIRKAVGAKWDEVHAEDALKARRKEAKQAEEEVVGLYQLRKQILENIELAYSVGNPMEADNLRKALAGVNTELDSALPKAISLAQAMGDNAAVAKLQNIRMQLQDVSGKILDAKQVNDLFTSSAGTAFDGVAESIAGVIDGTKSWKEALGSLRNTFLKFISDVLAGLAKMIIQQQIMQALGMSGSGGGGIGSWISGLFSVGMAAFGMFDGGAGIGAAGAIGGGASGVEHITNGAGLGGFNVYHSGGVVGTSGGRIMQAPSSWFANAPRFHSGGLPGLQPNEVPAVLQKGEEVLTRNDPRNILNGGSSGKSSPDPSPLNVKIVNAIDAGDMVQQGLNTSAGERAILNMVRNNPSAFKAALG